MKTKTLRYVGILATALPGALYATESVEAPAELEKTVIIGDQNAMIQNIRMEPSLNTKLQGPVEDIPRSVEVIGTEEFSQKGAINLQETLKYSPGVFSGPFGIDTRIDTNLVRGIAPQQFQDGFTAFEGFYNAPRVEVFTLDSVEVIKGPASTLFGQGALGGIINTNSKLPEEEDRGEINLQAGSDGRIQAAVDTTGKLNESGSLLYRVVALGRGSDTEVDFVEDDAIVFMPSVTIKASEQTKFTILGNHQEQDTGSSLQFVSNLDSIPGAGAGPFGAGTLAPFNSLDIDTKTFVGEPNFDTYETNSDSLSMILEHRFNETFSLDANLRYWDSESKYQYTQAIGYGFAPPGLRLLPFDPTIGGLLPPSVANKVGSLPVLDTDGDAYRLGYKSDKKLEIISNNVIFKAQGDWLGLDHKAQFGLDYVEADSQDDRARDRDLETLYALQLVQGGDFSAFNFLTGEANVSLSGFFLGDSKINVLDPVYAGQSADIPSETEFRNSTSEQTGLFVGDVVSYENFIASLNLRYDRIEQSYDRQGIYSDGNDSTNWKDSQNDFNSDFGVMYQFDNGISPYYSYAESFTPNDADPNGELVDPSEGTQHEVGVKYLSDNAGTFITAAVFQIEEDNRVINPDPSSFRVIDAEYKGAELSIKHRIHDVQLESAYTYIDTEEKNGSSDNLKVTNVPDQMANAWATYMPSDGDLKGFRAGLGARYIGNTVSENNNFETAGYTLFDAMLGYRYDSIDLQLNVSNLANKDYIVGISEGEFGTTSFQGQERFINVTGKYLF
jgi:iron complex outermembrane receptor protein